MIRLAGLMVAMLLAAPATAAPLDPALQQQLLGLYDSYGKAIAAGKLQDALALRTDAVRTQAQKDLKTAKQQREMLEMARAMTPDALEVVHATLNRAGDRAQIITVASKTMPKGKPVPGAPPPGSIVRSGLTLDFVKQGTAWKFDNQIFGPDPGKITACKDYRGEPSSAYDLDKDVSLGGQIIRVDYQADYTLIVVRVVDEEACAFLPNRDELVKGGMDTELLVPYALVEIAGSPHRTDKQKVLVEKIDVQSED